MTEATRFSLLRIIRHNGDMTILVDEGYRYSQLATLVSELVDEGFVCTTEEGMIVISPKGIDFINGFGAKNHMRSPELWITPQSSYWHKPIDKFQIYIPT